MVMPTLALQNATRQNSATNCEIRLVIGSITWTNPTLNTATGGVYNRIATTTSRTANPGSPATAFAEVGWYKNIILGIYPEQDIQAVYTDSNGNVQRISPQPPLSGTLQFQLQYDPLINNAWFFYVNGATIGSTISYGTNFTSGCVAVAGGEVVNGVEDMGNT